MINLLLSLAAALVTFCAFFFSGLAHALGSIFPALVAGIVAYILLARRTVKQLEALMAQVQKELAGRRIESALARVDNTNISLDAVRVADRLARDEAHAFVVQRSAQAARST